MQFDIVPGFISNYRHHGEGVFFIEITREYCTVFGYLLKDEFRIDGNELWTSVNETERFSHMYRGEDLRRKMNEAWTKFEGRGE